jgi:hypothetical protein
MSTNIKLKRSAVAGKIPTTLNLEFGEVAINTNDGKLFFKKDDGTEAIVTIQETTKTLVDSLNVDADTLDGLDSTQFLRSDQDGALIGSLTLKNRIRTDAKSASPSSFAKVQIASFLASSYSSAKYTIQSTDTVTNEVQISELLVVHNGTTAIATEYGTIHTSENPNATYDVDIDDGDVRLLAQRISSNVVQYTISETLFVKTGIAFGSFSWDSGTESPDAA